MEAEGPRIFVNLPDQESIGVVDRNTGVVTNGKIPGYTNVHAMALDEASHRLFATSLQPGRLMWSTRNPAGSLPCFPASLALTIYG